MAPLPVQLSTAVAGSGIPASTLSTFYLTAHTSTPSHISPVAIPCHTGSTIFKRWVGSSVVSHDGDDDASWKTVGDDDDTGDQITVEETPVDEPTPTTNEDDQTVGDDDHNPDSDMFDEPKTTVEETSPDEATPPTTGEDDDEDAGWKTVGDEGTHNKTSVDDTPLPVEPAGTEALADTITSELVEKYGNMPTSIDDCINTEDEIVNGNNNMTVNCTALANMETWYFLPCDVECHDDLEEIIPGVVVGSGLSGGLLPTILNNHGLWSNNPVSQTAIVNWLTNHLQRVRNLLSADAFDWTRVQSNAEELLNHPPVDLPLENDAFPAPESVPEVATPEAIEAAEAAVEEAKNALENLRYMTKNPHAIEAAEDHLAEQQEKLRQLKENAQPAEVPSEEGLPSDPVEPVEPAESTFSPEEIAAWTQKLKNAVKAVKTAMRNYTSVRGSNRVSRRMQLARKHEWMEAKKAVKAIRDHIHETGLPIDDIPELEEPVRFTDPEVEAAKKAAKEANDALRATRKLTQDEEVIQALEEAAQNAADVARYHKNNAYDVRPRQTVEQAQNQLNWVQEVSNRGAEQLRAIDEHLQNMIDATPEGPPELVQSFQRGLDTIQRLKQSTQAYMAKVAKDLLKAERALKRANGELKVTWPEDPVEGEQPHPYGPDRTYDGANDDEWHDVDENKDGEEPTESEEPVETEESTETDEPTENEPTENDEWHDADENKEGEESTEPDQPTETDEPTEVNEPIEPAEHTEPEQKPDSDEPTETTEKTEGDEETEVEKPIETSEPTEPKEETEVDEPTETEENSNGDEPSGDGESIEIEVIPSGGGVPFVPPGVVPPVIVPIPGIGDVLAPTKVLQKAAEELKDAADWLLGLNDKKDHKAIKKAEKKIKEAKKKLKKEQEKEKKKQGKEEKKKQDKADKKDKEDEKSTTMTTKAKPTSTSTSSSKTPEPTVHHKQHEAEITFHGEHKHKFELYGKDWARGKNDADELHTNMEKCGMEIKDWEFSYADKKPEIKTSDWSFYAKGELLRKAAADVRCLNKAIHEANGPKDLISETDGIDKTSDAPEKAEVAAQVTFSEKHFTLFGKGFAKDKDAGEKLKDKMAKCSKVKDWKFYTQKKDHDMKLKEQGWDFYAEGEVKEVKRKCLNEAIQGMGGPDEAIADGDV
jgi:hypothetical protein